MRAAQKSVFRRILNPILIALIFQAALLYGVIAFGGTLAQLRENTYGFFREKVDSSRDQLENEMVQRWSNLTESAECVLDEMTLLLQESRLTVMEVLDQRDQLLKLLDASAADVLYLLRKNSVSGAFLILDGSDELEKPALYFTDPDPESNPSDYSDLQVERAPSLVTKRLGLALSANWLPNLPMHEGKPAYFEKPLQAAWDYDDVSYQDLGYWGGPDYRSGDGVRDQTRVITYSVPLVYEGYPIGVLGVEIALDYLAKQLPEKSLGQTGSALVLAVSTDGQQTYIPAVSSSGALRQMLLQCQQLTLHTYDGHADYRQVKGVNDAQPLIAREATLRLYNTHTPFEQEQWSLLGMVYRSDLLRSVEQFQMTLLLACLISFSLGIVQVFVVSRRIARPIALLSGRVKRADPSQTILLPKLHIVEIDELSDSIEYLSAEVADAAARLSRILEMADISIGAFEYSEKGDGAIFLTSQFFNILAGRDVVIDSTSMSAEDFGDTVRRIVGQAEEAVTEKNQAVFTFCFSNAGIPYWSRLKVIRDGERTLGVATDITQEVLEKKRLEYDRDYDILTNLFNRRAFHVGIHQLMDAPQNLKTAALIMMDLDNLKYINDTYGHDLGDEYIRSAAAALKKASGRQALVARLSGDEFVVFLHGFDGREGIRQICAGIQAELQRTNIMLPDGTTVQIRASAGLSWYPDDARTAEELVRYADFAMYMVKRVNKGQFTDFNLETYHRESYLLHGREELNLILEQGRLDYHFQPVFDAKTGAVFGYEALMRMRSETVKTPLELLSLARSQSRLQRVEELTMFLAMERFLQLDISGGDAHVFLNSIPSQILTPEQVTAFETKFDRQLQRVIVEITEEERSDPKITRIKQDLIRKWGASMALDDFGVGYNGETALVDFAPQYIKLDISIVRGIGADHNRYQLMENLISYSRERGIKVIAEGVEYEEDMQALIRAGVDYLQGYFLAKPSGAPLREYPASTKLVQEANARLG